VSFFSSSSCWLCAVCVYVFPGLMLRRFSFFFYVPRTSTISLFPKIFSYCFSPTPPEYFRLSPFLWTFWVLSAQGRVVVFTSVTPWLHPLFLIFFLCAASARESSSPFFPPSFLLSGYFLLPFFARFALGRVSLLAWTAVLSFFCLSWDFPLPRVSGGAVGHHPACFPFSDVPNPGRTAVSPSW